MAPPCSPCEHLIRALADLVGPFQPPADGGVAEEVLPIRFRRLAGT
jgi:hypothetical protein